MTGEAIAALARSYVGLPFATGARGPHAYDCLGVVVSIAWDAGALPWGWDFSLANDQIKGLIRDGGFRPLPGAEEIRRPPALGDLVVWGDSVARGVGVVVEADADPLLVVSIPAVGVVERRLSRFGPTMVVAFEFSPWTPERLAEFEEATP